MVEAFTRLFCILCILVRCCTQSLGEINGSIQVDKVCMACFPCVEGTSDCDVDDQSVQPSEHKYIYLFTLRRFLIYF